MKMNKDALVISVVDKMGPKSSEQEMESPSEEMDYNEGLVIVSKKILKAIDKNDPEMFAKALKDFLAVCEMMPEESEED